VMVRFVTIVQAVILRAVEVVDPRSVSARLTGLVAMTVVFPNGRAAISSHEGNPCWSPLAVVAVVVTKERYQVPLLI